LILDFGLSTDLRLKLKWSRRTNKGEAVYGVKDIFCKASLNEEIAKEIKIAHQTTDNQNLSKNVTTQALNSRF
jgi:hypothetical protein